MTTQPIKDGELASADAVMNNLAGQQFKNYAQLLYNSARTGFNSKLNVATGAPNLKNIKYDVFNTDTASSKTGWYYDVTNKYYLAKWSNAFQSDTTNDTDSVTNPNNAFDENDGTYAEKTGAGAGSSSIELGKTFGSKNVAIVRIKTTVTISSGVDPSCSIKLQKYNGSVWSDVSTLASGTSSCSYDNYVLLGEDVQGIRIQGNVSNNVGGSPTWSIKFYTIEYGGIDTTNSLIFQTTGLNTITDCIPTWNALIDGDNTLTVSISADGTNYEEVTDATIHRFTNTGTNLYVKFTITRVDTAAVDKISEYAVWYNTGAA